MTSHGCASHGTVKVLNLLGNPALKPVIQNQRERPADFDQVGCDQARSPARGRPVAATSACGDALPPKRPRPPIQGDAFSHRRHFLPMAKAGDGKVRRVREGATQKDCSTGSGGRRYVYRWDRAGRKGQECHVTARGALNSCRVEFDDGFVMVTSRHAIRRVLR